MRAAKNSASKVVRMERKIRLQCEVIVHLRLKSQQLNRYLYTLYMWSFTFYGVQNSHDSKDHTFCGNMIRGHHAIYNNREIGVFTLAEEANCVFTLFFVTL